MKEETDWWPVYVEYMPELVDLITEEYEWWRNRRRITSTRPEQDEYRINPKRYGPDFWAEVIHRHYAHRCSFLDTFPFLFRICGHCMPWPGMCAQIPLRLQEDFSLGGRFHGRDGKEVLGNFKFGRRDNVIKEFEEGSYRKSKDTWICYALMHPRNWRALTGKPQGRELFADWLARLPGRPGFDKVTEELGPRIGDFVRLIGSAPPPRVRPPAS